MTATVPLDLEGEEEALPIVKETPETVLLQRSDWQLVQQALEHLPTAYCQILAGPNCTGLKISMPDAVA